MRQRTDAEVLCQRLPEIGEGRSRSEIDAGLHPSAVQQHGHIFAGVIRAGRRRIVAVIGGDDEQIIVSEFRHETRQPEMTREMLREIHAAFPTITNERIRTFITGSGGSPNVVDVRIER